ncbi:MAG: hypothetical protein FJ042_05485 [Candidatus Cloacimonetes bacterium]|nr:hypothetical protein [Candidatus Cloacimonadota bacterium]
MKRWLLLLIPMLFIVALGAIDWEYSGEFRTRAAMYNDYNDMDGGHIDNWLVFNIASKLHKQLDFVWQLEVGNVIWGGPMGGWIGSRSVNIETEQLFIEYTCPQGNQIRVGQIYWADHRGLIIADSFSGLLLSRTDLAGFNAEFGFIKGIERQFDQKDDYNVFFAQLKKEDPMLMGLFASYGKDQWTKDANFTLMPNVGLGFDPVDLDLVAFVDYQSKPGVEDRIGYGASAKATVGLGDLQVGADLLYVNKEGLTLLSPYYMNGLYLHGYGAHHDGVGIGWWDGYGMGNNDGLLSAVGFVNLPVGEDLKVFGAAGYLSTIENNDIGIEVNAGLEKALIKDLLDLSCFGAVGFPGEYMGANLPEYIYLLGTTIKVNF